MESSLDALFADLATKTFTTGVPETTAATAVETTRVLHVINGEHYSGAERVQDLLAIKLPEHGYQLGFACVKPGQFATVRRAQQVPLIDLPMSSRVDLRVVHKLVDVIRNEDYRLVHAHTPRSAIVGAGAARVAGVPLVYHVHSPTCRDSTRWLVNRLSASAEKFSIRNAAALIAVSPSLRDHMIRSGFAEERVHYVANGVPGIEFDVSRQVPATGWTLGMVALFRPRKGTEMLLDAVAALRRQGEDIRIRAIGRFETDDYRREILRQVSALDLDSAVEWAGFVSDVPGELARMDLLVLPSLFGEGLPMVVLEAMAAGVPCVASSVEGIPTAIRDGKEGVLVKPGDWAALAAGIRRITSGELDWQQLRRQAYIRHAERFSDRAMAEGVARVYDQVLTL